MPLVDLRDFTTYTEYTVKRLIAADGRALLCRLGVRGAEQAFADIVHEWDGHALALTLLATYLVECWNGDVAHVGDVPPPTADEPRYQRVQRLLRRYDEHLSEAERAFLTLFSAFRTPVREDAFEMVFRAKTDASDLSAPIAALDDAAFADMLKRLRDHRILRYDPHARYYTAHPLIRAHYLAQFADSSGTQIQATHKRIKSYYLFLADNLPYYDLTERSMAPRIEAVHHACCAGDYDVALKVYIDQFRLLPEWGNKFHDRGAFETDLEVMRDFFPKGDLSRDPQVSDDHAKRFILHEVGLCLMNLGHLHEAKPIIVSMNYPALIELHTYLGELADSARTAHEALLLVRGMEPVDNECDALCSQAWVSHLCGDLEEADAAFKEAEALKRSRITSSSNVYLYGQSSVHQADHLQRTGDVEYAREVIEANLSYAQLPGNVIDSLASLCHRILGDLDTKVGHHKSAREHYNKALKIARAISVRHVLIEALIARGRWAAQHGEVEAARIHLDEALGYAVADGYRLYEADSRIGLAWAYLGAGDVARARQEAARAQQMSAEMGYHWGQVDAAEVGRRQGFESKTP